MMGFYEFDTNTNVCPSIHVIGSVAILLCAWYSKHFRSTGWRVVSVCGNPALRFTRCLSSKDSILTCLRQSRFVSLPITSPTVSAQADTDTISVYQKARNTMKGCKGECALVAFGVCLFVALSNLRWYLDSWQGSSSFSCQSSTGSSLPSSSTSP